MKTVKIFLTLTTLALGVFFIFRNSVPAFGQDRQAGDDAFRNWRPTRELPGIDFVGNQKCISCHQQKQQLSTAMAHAIIKPADSKFLNEFPFKPFTNGDYTYDIKKSGDEIIYTVSDGKNTLSFPVLYSMGEGREGQVYIFKYNDALYESRVTLYRAIQGLDFTVAQPHEIPTGIESAIGRKISEDDAQRCFSCHATGAVVNKTLELGHISEAISCEACHGAGGNHVKAVANNDKDLQIFNPSRLITLEQTQEFCGACHVGFEKALELPPKAATIRFQPYRLFKSAAHDPNDPRLSCTACHDPHDNLERNSVYYDQKCFACHMSSAQEQATKERAAPPCPVQTTDCVSCHMPKTDVPVMHHKFTDHWIRIVRPNETIER